MTNRCNAVIDNYIGWLSNNFIVTNARDNCIITIPYKRPDGDFIEVKLVEEGGKSYLTDNGGTYDYLFISGMDLLSLSTSREMLIRTILNSNGVTLYNDVELAVELNEDIDMGLAMSKLIRAINSLQNLIYTTRPTGVRFFPEKVENFFVSKGINYEANYVVRGKTRDHRFDFYIPSKELYLVRTLSTDNQNWAKRLATDTMFSFVDTKGINPHYKGVAFIDDTRGSVWEGDAIAILKNYSDYVVTWSNREDITKLVA